MILKLTTKDFSKELLNKCSMGENLHDILGWAAGYEAWEDFECLSEAYDAGVDYVLKAFDYDEALLQKFNKQTPKNPEKKWLDSGLLFGAWMKLERTAIFDTEVKEYKDQQKDAAYECLGDYIGRDDLNPDLAKELEESYTCTYEEGFKEWLSGDYRGNCDGVERALSKEFGSDNDVEVDLNIKTAWKEAQFTVDPVLVQRDVEEWDGVETGKPPGEKRIKDYLIGYISSRAESKYDKEMSKRKEQRAEREKTEAYQKERREKEEEAERQRLLAMKRK